MLLQWTSFYKMSGKGRFASSGPGVTHSMVVWWAFCCRLQVSEVSICSKSGTNMSDRVKYIKSVATKKTTVTSFQGLCDEPKESTHIVYFVHTQLFWRRKCSCYMLLLCQLSARGLPVHHQLALHKQQEA